MISLYIHIPFCKRKCFYCSFTVCVGQERYLDLYLKCLAAEMNKYKGKKIDSIYVGGGTPTLMSDAQIKIFFSDIKKYFEWPEGIECTIEANPDGLTFAKLMLLKKLGVNRLSLGVQSLNDKYLKYLGRTHDSRDVASAYKNIRNAGFNNISLDFMCMLPSQTIAEMQDDIHKVVALQGDHVSLYSLTIEKNSAFFVKKVQLQNERVQVKQYMFATGILEAAGFVQYEISNFAKDGKMSKHNLNYWRGGNYIGLGVGAHSHVDGRRCWNVSGLMAYIKRIEEQKSPVEGEEKLSSNERLIETLLFGLRMNDGVNLLELEKRFKCILDEQRQMALRGFINSGFLISENGRVKTTVKGRLVLDELSARLI